MHHKSPSKLVVFLKIYSKINQPIAPALAEMTVFVTASIAILSNVKALPTLNPYQPIHTNIPPINVMMMWC